MLIRRPLISGLLVATALTVGAGCSSSGSTSKADADNSSTTAAESKCPGTEATLTITESGETAEFSHAAGASLADGAAYTVYLSGSEIDPKTISMLNTPEPTEGEHMTTVALTVFNAEETPPAITAGTEIAFTPDFGVLTFRVTDTTGSESYNSAAEGEGNVTVTQVGETVCFAIDYSDDEKTLTGTVEAPVKDL